MYIIKKTLPTMLKISIFRGVEYWEEEKEELMNVFSRMSKSGLRIKTALFDDLVK